MATKAQTTPDNNATLIEVVEVEPTLPPPPSPPSPSRLHRGWHFVKTNLTLAEISGGLGDLGTLIPLLVSLSKTSQVSLSASLIFGGLYNIITGFIYGIPMCVQPMKSISSIALATSMPMQEIVAAGFWVSSITLVLGLTRTIKLINDWIPLAIVRGIQLGTGMNLLIKGCTTILDSRGWDFDHYAWLDNYVVAIAAFGVVLAWYHSKRNWSAIALFGFGLVVAGVRVWALGEGKGQVPKPGFEFPRPFVPTWADFKNGFLKAGLGQ
ncbi:hypothetical protein HK104_003394, partial [Borealophlyctis nickersoniae]